MRGHDRVIHANRWDSKNQQMAGILMVVHNSRSETIRKMARKLRDFFEWQGGRRWRG
jgi:hypothetical protein